MQKDNYVKAFKLFFKFFIFTWLVIIFNQLIVAYSEVDLEERKDLFFWFNIILNFMHIFIFVALIIKIKNENDDLIKISELATNKKNPLLFFSVLTGLCLGYFFPLMSNSFIYWEGTMMAELAKLAIDAYVKYFDEWTFWQFLLYFLVGTVIYNFFREIFFRQILLNLIHRDENITKSTIQVSILFVLCYYIYQINQLDFIGIFVLSIVLSFIYFKTKSLISAILAGIAFDLPVYALYFVEDLKVNAESYLTINSDNIILVAIAVYLCYYSLNYINKISVNEQI